MSDDELLLAEAARLSLLAEDVGAHLARIEDELDPLRDEVLRRHLGSDLLDRMNATRHNTDAGA